MTEPAKVAAARIEAERAKGALLETARELVERLQPHNLVDDLWESAKVKGADLAEDAVDAVAKRPVAIGGVVAALAMFLAREPLKKATVKFYDAMTPLFEPREKAPKKRETQTRQPALKAKEATAAKPVSSKVERPAKPPAKRPARTPRAAQKKTEKA